MKNFVMVLDLQFKRMDVILISTLTIMEVGLMRMETIIVLMESLVNLIKIVLDFGIQSNINVIFLIKLDEDSDIDDLLN